ncbi:ABC transporter ATP-binding protein [Deinococcus irradiatisoli]|uniref:ABC transporter ATP-binding protein n=1 Tax=Deinococcus irradiatisoli TaxID=2202254 RepID=A0A2Z3JJ25_9DEIO|nr:ABC transporter ATP-binding protein [Deinococcus irradiatisoli]AWN23360.1 ABC transporter ATP-binding protein [Deinococcus irradiatisoli]
MARVTTAGAAPAPALQAQNLSQTFGDTEVLHGVSLQVARGEVVAVMGPSGSGKSTLLHLLGGLGQPSGGEVYWEGVRVDQLSVDARAQRRVRALGLVFQHHYLLPDLNLLDNLRVPGMILGEDLTARAEQLLQQVGLGGRGGAYPEVLSGGERQRLAVARALVARPAALLADEPTGSLDRANARRVAELMIDLAREHASGVLLVTHDEALAALADRQIDLLDGRVVPPGSPATALPVP